MFYSVCQVKCTEIPGGNPVTGLNHAALNRKWHHREWFTFDTESYPGASLSQVILTSAYLLKYSPFSEMADLQRALQRTLDQPRSTVPSGRSRFKYDLNIICSGRTEKEKTFQFKASLEDSKDNSIRQLRCYSKSDHELGRSIFDAGSEGIKESRYSTIFIFSTIVR